MKNNDFISFEYLHAIILVPKKDNENKTFKWQEIVSFEYRRENFLSFLFYITRNQCDYAIQSQKCSALKADGPNLSLGNLDKLLYTAPLKTQNLKWENLQQLLPYIPPIYHSFYQHMDHHESKKKHFKAKGKNKTSNHKQEKDDNFQEENAENILYSGYEDYL
ncbi:hypothetical protein ABEB36_004600 [Hypothenemus hampei]|uniref:Uncharacterized protein n=1 Tax=Hypothenemus hampei TaxID=57062 RepID=A0ABD1F6I6_HYPHA